MSDKFKAIVLNQTGEKFSREIKNLDKSFLSTGDVLIKIDYSDKNLVEQGFVFEQLISGHQCGCGESFTPVKDLNKENGPFS